MSNPSRSDNKAWDDFFDFVSDVDDQLTREEVQAELQRYGIDSASAVSKVRTALEARRAQAKLAQARQQRETVKAKLFGVVSKSTGEVRGNIRQFIAEKLQGTGQAAYFRKLKDAASEDDLQSLMDDLARLDVLTSEKESDGVE